MNGKGDVTPEASGKTAAVVYDEDALRRGATMDALPAFACVGVSSLHPATLEAAVADAELFVARLDGEAPAALAVVAVLADLAPELAVVVVRADSSPEFLLAAHGVGAQDVLIPADAAGGRLERAALSAVYRKRFSEAAAARVRRAEFVSLERWSQVPRGTSVSARLFGGGPLSETDPRGFDGLSREYADLVLESLQSEAYSGRGDVSGGLRRLAAELGHLSAGPRDVIALHTRAMRTRLDGRSDGVAAHAYMQEARYVLVQLMGYLVAFYRAHAMGAAARHTGSGGGGGEE